MTNPKLSDEEAAERIEKLKPFTITHGAKLEVFDLGSKGIQILISSPPNPEDCMAVPLNMNNVYSLVSWLQVFYLQSGSKNGKSKEENGSGN